MSTISPEWIERKGVLENVAFCDLCNGAEFKPELRKNEWKILKCMNCGLVFTSPRYNRDHILSLYQNKYYERASGYLQMQLGEIPAEMLQFPKNVVQFLCTGKERNVLRSLDIGCGGGLVVLAFKKAGWEAVGIDPNIRAIHAGRKIGLDLREMDFEKADIGKFNAITAFHVLEHVISPKAFLQRCKDILHDDGLLIIEVPDFSCRESSKMGGNWPHLYPDLHLYQFTIETLSRYLVNSGFKIVKVERVHGRGPLENRVLSQNGNTPRGKFKDLFFGCRELVYWIPKARNIVRYLFWEILGYGQFLRVIARKNRFSDGHQ